MVCPIMSNHILHEGEVLLECQGRDCAWYNHYDEACAIQILSNTAINLAEVACGQRTIFTKEI